MTDFFADLEREIRAAHPRRSRPPVPVRGLAVTATVAASIVAVVMALGALQPAAEREVAQAPPAEQGWSAYPGAGAPSCQTSNPTNVHERVPRRLSERFAVLRSPVKPGRLVSGDLPGVVEVYARGVREHDGVVVFPARLGCEGERGALGMCVLSSHLPSETRKAACVELTREPMVATLTEDAGDVVEVTVLASDDAVERVTVRGGALGGETRVADQNLVFSRRDVDDAGQVSVGLDPPDSITPLNCAGQPDMESLRARLAIFRRPADAAPLDVTLPEGWERAFLTQARRSTGHVVFPAGDATCGTGVCIMAEVDSTAECHALQVSDWFLQLERRHGDRLRVAVLVSDDIRKVAVTSDGRTWEVPVRDNVATFEASAVEYAVEPAS